MKRTFACILLVLIATVCRAENRDDGKDDAFSKRIAKLVELFDSDNRFAREQAGVELTQELKANLKASRWGMLAPLIEKRPAEVREKALQTLRLAANSIQATEKSIDFLNWLAAYPDPAVRASAIKALSAVPSEKTYALALKLLADSDDGVALEAGDALHALFKVDAAKNLAKSHSETAALCAAFERIEKLGWIGEDFEKAKTKEEKAALEHRHKRSVDSKDALLDVLCGRFVEDPELVIPFVCRNRRPDGLGKSGWMRMGGIVAGFSTKQAAPIIKKLLALPPDESDYYAYGATSIMNFNDELVKECKGELLALQSKERDPSIRRMATNKLVVIAGTDQDVRHAFEKLRDDEDVILRSTVEKILNHVSKP